MKLAELSSGECFIYDHSQTGNTPMYPSIFLQEIEKSVSFVYKKIYSDETVNCERMIDGQAVFIGPEVEVIKIAL